MKKVLVLGGGFAGIEASIWLKKAGFDITLVTDRQYMFIYPTSIWVPVRDAEFEDVCIALQDLQKAHHFDWIQDEVLAIKAAEHKVVCRNRELTDYAYLVVAMGAGKMKHPGIEHTLSICGQPEGALVMRDKMDTLVSKGSGKIAMGFGGNPKDATGVRGGPAFELMFNVHNYLKKKGIRDNYDLTFFAPMPKPGAKLGERSLKMMDRIFNKLNIKKHFGKKIKAFMPDGVVFQDDSKLESDFTMFIPANTGHPVMQASDLSLNEAGFVKINDYCEAEGLENIYVVGDVAQIEGPEWRAKQGHVAEVMARNTVHNILAKERGRTERKGYREHLNILCVMDSGNGAAFVYRDQQRNLAIPMPVVGHWLKKGWGWYYRNSKLGKIPRIPGM
jgi:sulfide:quinone oxidoreductase